jgi:hypothetical protein
MPITSEYQYEYEYEHSDEHGHAHEKWRGFDPVNWMGCGART